MRLSNILLFLTIALVALSDYCYGMVAKLSVIVPSDQVPIELTINEGSIAMHYSALGEMCRWWFVGDTSLFPLDGELLIDEEKALTPSACGASCVTRKDIFFTRGEELILNKTRKLTFTWSEDTRGIVMILHHSEVSSTAFYFTMHPRLISVHYNNEKDHNINRVVIDVCLPCDCTASGKGGSSKVDDMQVGFVMSERELVRRDRVIVPQTCKQLSLRVHEDTHYGVDTLERYKYDVLFFT